MRNGEKCYQGRMGSIFRERERDDNLGENRIYPMEINLKDSNSVQLNYNSDHETYIIN